MNLAEKYINGLKKAYIDNGGGEVWGQFEGIMHGASKENIENLKNLFPDIPQSLVDLLLFADGTHYRKYGEKKVCLCILGSDIDGYPYYLSSSEQILKETESGAKCNYDLDDFLYWVNENGYTELYDDKLTDDPEKARWLQFSNCINNGGTSMLYIDFSPSEKGKAGQVVRYLHDPDQYKVIADSFDNYLDLLISDGYSFINEESVEGASIYNAE